jgi:hypothetical protein
MLDIRVLHLFRALFYTDNKSTFLLSFSYNSSMKGNIDNKYLLRVTAPISPLYLECIILNIYKKSTSVIYYAKSQLYFHD